MLAKCGNFQNSMPRENGSMSGLAQTFYFVPNLVPIDRENIKIFKKK